MTTRFLSMDLTGSIRVDKGVDDRTTTGELKKIFARFGRIIEIKIVESSDNPNATTFSATVTFRVLESAKRAAMEMDEVELRGIAMDVWVVGL